jgi:hypothetical protein
MTDISRVLANMEVVLEEHCKNLPHGAITSIASSLPRNSDNVWHQEDIPSVISTPPPAAPRANTKIVDCNEQANWSRRIVFA